MRAVIVEDRLGWALHLQLSDDYHMNKPLHGKNKECFGMQTRRWSIKEGGTYISNQVRMHAYHLTLKKKKICTYFWIVTGKSLMRSSKMVERERSIVVMIIKNRFWSWNKRTMGWTLPLGKSQRNKKINLAIGKPRVFNPCSQETPSFQTLWSGIIRKHQVFQPVFCHPLKTSPGKSYFSHLSYHILSIWVGRPS